MLAEVLTLPSESYLGDQMDEVDVDAIHRAREGLSAEIAGRLRADLLRIYRANPGAGAFSIDSAEMARRRLKNLCLSYLARLQGDEEIQALCMDQYRQADNMTDSLAALSLIAHGDFSTRESVLADFERRWAVEPLVLDKWFAVQAMSPRADTLQRVRELMSHPAFSLRNPNRVRALIGSFVAGNPVRFHDAGGEGYAFLADRALELDGDNPQVAARLLRNLSRWRRQDARRRPLMQAQLERVLASPGLSKDSYEVVSKSLQTADAG